MIGYVTLRANKGQCGGDKCSGFGGTGNKPAGEQAFWIDGRLLGRWRGINWRKTEGLKANALTLESYVTDRWTKNPVNTVYFDNLIIAREYIGPAGKL